MNEFKIDSLDYTFRPAKLSPIELLSLQTIIDFDNLNQTIEVFTFILEHLEVKVGDTWTSVKVKGKEIYVPAELETNLLAAQELCIYFLGNILKPLFTK